MKPAEVTATLQVVVLTVGLALLPHRAGGDPPPVDLDALLTQFEPALYFQHTGIFGDRLEFPTDFVLGDDPVERNAQERLGAYEDVVVYRHALEKECSETGTTYYVLQYYYYYTRNWTGWCFTHEHDWEWVYVIAGWSMYLQEYVGFAAILSSHDTHNLQSLDRGHTYLFPLINTSDMPIDDDPYLDRDRRLSEWWDEDLSLSVPRVYVEENGNAFSATICSDNALYKSVADRHVADEASWQLGYEGGGDACNEITDEKECYGDPDNDCFGFSDLSECGECDESRYVPWKRAGLWGEDSVGSDFWFPSVFDLKTDVDPEPGTWVELEFLLNGGAAELCWTHETAGDSLECEVTWRRDVTSRRIELGRVWIGMEAEGCWAVGECPGQRGSGGAGGDEADLCSPVSATDLAEGIVELWLTRSEVPRRLLGRSDRGSQGQEADALWLPLTIVSSRCEIRYRVQAGQHVTLSVHDVSGRVVAAIVDAQLQGGSYTTDWACESAAGCPAPAGVYWIRLRAGDSSAARRVIVLR